MRTKKLELNSGTVQFSPKMDINATKNRIGEQIPGPKLGPLPLIFVARTRWNWKIKNFGEMLHGKICRPCPLPMLKHSTVAPLVKHLLAAVEKCIHFGTDSGNKNLGSMFPCLICDLVLISVKYKPYMSCENYSKYGSEI